MSKKDKFVERMEYWCSPAGNLGYDQWQRWDIRVGGESDCASLVIHCLKEAGFDTGSATYTGNMSSNLIARGWKRVPNDGHPQKGDILLNDVNHVGVWTGYGVAQASGDEKGGITGGQSGDQTGYETFVTNGYYDYPWDCYLRYVGGDSASEVPKIRYRVKTAEDGWLDWMEDLYDTGGSGDDYAGILGHAATDIDFDNLSGWFEVDKNAAGQLTSLTVYYDTDISKTGGVYYKAVYRAHHINLWSAYCHDDEEGGTEHAPIDLIQIKLERAE